jgi:hypothetical protein
MAEAAATFSFATFFLVSRFHNLVLWVVGFVIRCDQLNFRLYGGLRSGQILFALAQAIKKLIAFATAADQNILVLEHRFDDTQNWFWAQIIRAIETVHRFENFFL